MNHTNTPAPIGADALRHALEIAEAALADIGDADREPGDDVAWCEARAAEALPTVRAALASAAQPADPVTVEAVAKVVRHGQGVGLDWLIEGGISALAVGEVLVCANAAVTDDTGSGEVYLAPAAAAPKTAPAAQGDADPIRALIAQHAEILDTNEWAYFELGYHRRTGWMAWITDRPLCMPPVINPDRKVLAQGQGDTADEACADAMRAARAAKEGGACA